MVNIRHPSYVLEADFEYLAYELEKTDRLVRIANKRQYFKFRGLTKFSGRFDHFEDPTTSTEKDPTRSILYVCLMRGDGIYKALSTCIAEAFGPNLEFDGNRLLGVYEITAPINLLDLRKEGAMSVGTVSAIMGTDNREISQSWSQHFYKKYKNVEGIIYSGAHNQGDCIALYDRAKPKVKLSKEPQKLEIVEGPEISRILTTLRIKKVVTGITSKK